jgi:hypothetical protein
MYNTDGTYVSKTYNVMKTLKSISLLVPAIMAVSTNGAWNCVHVEKDPYFKSASNAMYIPETAYTMATYTGSGPVINWVSSNEWMKNGSYGSQINYGTSNFALIAATWPSEDGYTYGCSRVAKMGDQLERSYGSALWQ